MKNLTLLLIACGLIFAASQIAITPAQNAAYASIDLKRFLPRPIYPVPDSIIAVTPVNNAAYASIDLKRFLPRPIYPVPDTVSAKSDITLI
jgi:hypothetical protein